MPETVTIRTKVSKGYQVVVPSKIRQTYGVSVGDEVIWTIDGKIVEASFAKKPGLENLVSIGRSGGKTSNAVEQKKRIQRGQT